jgi:hypothetical protein
MAVALGFGFDFFGVFKGGKTVMKLRAVWAWRLAGLMAAWGSSAACEDIAIGLIDQYVVAVADEEDDEEDGVTREVSIDVQRDGKTIRLTETVDGEFAGEIVEDGEGTEIRARSLEELKERFPEAYAAYGQKPANPAGKLRGAAGVSVQVTDNNGDRKVEVKEPGRKTTIRDRQGEAIELTVRQEWENGTRTERYDAPTVEALRRRYPEAAQIYERYRNGGGVQLGVQGAAFGRIGIGGAPGGPRKIVGEHNGRKITIRDENGAKIRVTATKTVDGKEETETFEAENLDELKKKHPEIAKVYEKLAGRNVAQPGNGAAGIVIGDGVPIRVQVEAGAAPVPVPALPEAPANSPAERELRMVKQLLAQSRKRLEKLAGNPDFADAEVARELAEELEAFEEKLEELEEKTKE